MLNDKQFLISGKTITSGSFVTNWYCGTLEYIVS